MGKKGQMCQGIEHMFYLMWLLCDALLYNQHDSFKSSASQFDLRYQFKISCDFN